MVKYMGYGVCLLRSGGGRCSSKYDGGTKNSVASSREQAPKLNKEMTCYADIDQRKEQGAILKGKRKVVIEILKPMLAKFLPTYS